MFLTIKPHTCAKLKCLNRNVYLYKNGFGIKLPTNFDVP